MRYGYWLPIFGGWLRNVEDEQMQPTWDYVSRLARRSEKIGFDLTLIAELNLNDIKGVDAPALDAWSTAAALAAVTETIELMIAVRPTFHLPALLLIYVLLQQSLLSFLLLLVQLQLLAPLVYLV